MASSLLRFRTMCDIGLARTRRRRTPRAERPCTLLMKTLPLRRVYRWSARTLFWPVLDRGPLPTQSATHRSLRGLTGE